LKNAVKYDQKNIRKRIDKGKLYTNFHTPIFMISSDYRLQKFGYNEEWLRNGIETKIPVTAFNSSNTPVPHNSEK